MGQRMWNRPITLAIITGVFVVVSPLVTLFVKGIMDDIILIPLDKE